MTIEQHLNMTMAAWAAVLEHWPPPSGTTPLKSLTSYLRSTRGTRRANTSWTPKLPPAVARRYDQIGEPVNLIDDVVWVYHHLDDEQVGSIDAPSRGAWSMLYHARADKDRFYEKVHLPLMRDISRRQKAAPAPLRVSD